MLVRQAPESLHQPLKNLFKFFSNSVTLISPAGATDTFINVNVSSESALRGPAAPASTGIVAAKDKLHSRISKSLIHQKTKQNKTKFVYTLKFEELWYPA
jgi:hypothetical protein